MQINFFTHSIFESKDILSEDQAVETICLFVKVAPVSHETKAKLS
jgi:hypothetical protein